MQAQGSMIDPNGWTFASKTSRKNRLEDAHVQRNSRLILKRRSELSFGSKGRSTGGPLASSCGLAGPTPCGGTPAEYTVISKGRKAAGQHCRVVQEECS